VDVVVYNSLALEEASEFLSSSDLLPVPSPCYGVRRK
jgi:hypothetical protein